MAASQSCSQESCWLLRETPSLISQSHHLQEWMSTLTEGCSTGFHSHHPSNVGHQQRWKENILVTSWSGQCPDFTSKCETCTPMAYPKLYSRLGCSNIQTHRIHHSSQRWLLLYACEIKPCSKKSFSCLSFLSTHC